MLLLLVCGSLLMAPAASADGEVPEGCATKIADFVPYFRGFHCSAYPSYGDSPGDVVKSWTVPAQIEGEVSFWLFGSDLPGVGGGGRVKATLRLAAGETLTLVLGTEGRATSVSKDGLPLLMAGGGDGAAPNYLAPAAKLVEVNEPGAALPPYPGDGQAYVNWTLTHHDPPRGTCVVPRLIESRPRVARRLLAQADCSVGEIRHRLGGPWRRYRVRRQWPRPGSRLQAGAAVDFLLTRR